MDQNLSEALHEKLDALGAPPRENPPPQVSDEPEGEIAEPDEGSPLEAEDVTPEPDLAEGQGEAEGEETAEQSEAEKAEGQRFKVAELAKAIGWEAKDLYDDLIVPLGNGEELTLGELKNRREEAAQAVQAVEQAWAQVQQAQQQVQQHQQQLLSGQQALSQEVIDAQGTIRAIEAQYSTVDWDKLEENDPGRAANERQKFATKYAEAKSKLQDVQQQQDQQRGQAMQQLRVQHDQALLQMVPEWRDPNVAQQESAAISQYLVGIGFQPQELQTIFDARARAVARDAWLWRQHQAGVEQGKQKLRQAPKQVMRPGRPGSRKTAQVKQVQALEQRALRSGSQNDKLAAARAIWQSSRQR